MVATLLLVIHVLVATLICVVILMQSSKGEGLSGAFGMGQGTTSFFGADTANVLVKITTVLAVIFMLTSLSLAYVQAQKAKSVTASERLKPQQDSTITTPPGTEETETTPEATESGPDTGTGGTDAVAPEGGATTTPPDAETPGTDSGTVEPATGTDEPATGTGTGETPDGATDTGPDQPTEPGPTDS
jgi:preprotein translocase subunit SecG